MWRDTHQLGSQTYRLRIYIAIDHDDEYLLEDGSENKVEVISTSISLHSFAIIREAMSVVSGDIVSDEHGRTGVIIPC